MEMVSISIPAALYVAIYSEHEEETSCFIRDSLEQLVSSESDIHSAGRDGTPVYPRPGSGTITGRVWEIADKLQMENGTTNREAVVKACISEGINLNTASTQYSHWRNASL